MRTLILLLTLSLASSSAFAQAIATDELEKKALAEKKKDDKKKEEPEGWKLKGNVGLTGSFTHTNNLVSSPEDGVTVQLGLALGINADWRSGQHGWENELKAQQTYSRTPALDVLIKSTDQLDLKSTYLYRLMDPKWLGFFGRFKLNTQLLRTNSVQADDTIYLTEAEAVDNLGNSGEFAPGEAGYKITGPFEPLTLRESAGAFAKPITEEKITLKVGLGLAAQHVIVRDGKRLIGPAAAPLTTGPAGGLNPDGRSPNTEYTAILYAPLDSSNDFGVELTADANGTIVKDLLTWKAAINLFQPFLPSDENLSGLDRLNAELTGALSLKLVKWLSVDYSLLLRRQPQVVEKWQVQNQVLLSAGFDII